MILLTRCSGHVIPMIVVFLVLTMRVFKQIYTNTTLLIAGFTIIKQL